MGEFQEKIKKTLYTECNICHMEFSTVDAFKEVQMEVRE